MKLIPVIRASLCLVLSFISTSLLAEVKPILGNVEQGKIKAALCTGCHGVNGEGKTMPDGQPAIPRIAGQIPGYFVKSMYDYKMDKRVDPVMNAISKGLTDVDIANLAAYYVTLKVQ